ncbi:hypothetical protein ACQP3D_25510, partial [Escherichia coli]
NTLELAGLQIAPGAGRWSCMPLIPALGRQRQVNLCEFEASLLSRVSARIGFKATQRNPVLKRQTTTTTNPTTTKTNKNGVLGK